MGQPAVFQQLRVLRHLGWWSANDTDGRSSTAYTTTPCALLGEAISHTEHLRLGLGSSPAAAGLRA